MRLFLTVLTKVQTTWKLGSAMLQLLTKLNSIMTILFHRYLYEKDVGKRCIVTILTPFILQSLGLSFIRSKYLDLRNCRNR